MSYTERQPWRRILCRGASQAGACRPRFAPRARSLRAFTAHIVVSRPECAAPPKNRLPPTSPGCSAALGLCAGMSAALRTLFGAGRRDRGADGNRVRVLDTLPAGCCEEMAKKRRSPAQRAHLATARAERHPPAGEQVPSARHRSSSPVVMDLALDAAGSSHSPLSPPCSRARKRGASRMHPSEACPPMTRWSRRRRIGGRRSHCMCARPTRARSAGLAARPRVTCDR